MNGYELCNAYSELNDPREQRQRFAIQQQVFSIISDAILLTLVQKSWG